MRESHVSANLDPIDLKILRLLQVDVNQSLETIAERVCLSHSPCWRRIKRMEEEGVIRARVALIDQDAMHLGMTVLTTVKLVSHSEDSLRRFEAEVALYPEIVECFSVFGNNDYVLKVVAPNVLDYERFLKERILNLPYVEFAKSMVALKRVKATTALPF